MTDQQKLTPDQELLELMRRKEEREAKQWAKQLAKETQQEEHHDYLVKRQQTADSQEWEAAMSWQARCDHRKGTAGKKKWRHVDYMIGIHTLPSGIQRINCQKCRFRAYPGDTADKCSYTLDNFMKGIKVPNPTRLSYAKWYEMTLEENTTNTPTRSEMLTKGPVPVTA